MVRGAYGEGGEVGDEGLGLMGDEGLVTAGEGELGLEEAGKG